MNGYGDILPLHYYSLGHVAATPPVSVPANNRATTASTTLRARRSRRTTATRRATPNLLRHGQNAVSLLDGRGGRTPSGTTPFIKPSRAGGVCALRLPARKKARLRRFHQAALPAPGIMFGRSRALYGTVDHHRLARIQHSPDGRPGSPAGTCYHLHQTDAPPVSGGIALHLFSAFPTYTFRNAPPAPVATRKHGRYWAFKVSFCTPVPDACDAAYHKQRLHRAILTHAQWRF